MWILLGAIAIAIFLFGLVQWAYSGAGLWSVWSLKKGLRFASRREWAEKEDEIRRTEKRTDQLLMSSFKVISGCFLYRACFRLTTDRKSVV